MEEGNNRILNIIENKNNREQQWIQKLAFEEKF